MPELNTPKLVLTDEDFVTVVLGRNQDVCPEFQHHPRVQWLDINKADPASAGNHISPQTRAILLTEGIPDPIYRSVTAAAQQRNVLYLSRKGPRAVLGTLYEMFPRQHGSGGNGNGHKPDVPEAAGKVKKFLAEHPPDLSKSSAEEARRLFAVAKNVGVITTFGSLTQAISVMKRKAQSGEIPKSARRHDPKADALQILDDAIAGLSLMREWVESTAKENSELRSRFVALQKALGPVEA